VTHLSSDSTSRPSPFLYWSTPPTPSPSKREGGGSFPFSTCSGREDLSVRTIFYGTGCTKLRLPFTARSVKDETRNGYQNEKRNPNRNHETIVLGLRVAPPDPRPSGRESRQELDFLGRESTPEAKKREKGPRVGRSGRELA